MSVQVPPQDFPDHPLDTALPESMEHAGSASLQGMEPTHDQAAGQLEVPPALAIPQSQPPQAVQAPSAQPQGPPLDAHGQAGLPPMQIEAGTSMQGGQGQIDGGNGVYILRELQNLATRVDSVAKEVSHVTQEVSQVKKVQMALEALIRTSAIPPLIPAKCALPPKKKARKKGPPKEVQEQPLPTEPQLAPTPPPEMEDLDPGIYDWPPVKTVEEVWREMYEGLDGRPSLMALEEQYASAWRRKKGQRQRFCEKKQVCEYIKHLASENRCSHQKAIQYLADKRESLCKLLLRLRQFKKSAREMGMQMAANVIPNMGAQQMQPEMHNGMQMGVEQGGQNSMQIGMQMGMQPGMQPGGQSGMESATVPVMQAGMHPLDQSGMMQTGMQGEMQTDMQHVVQPEHSRLQSGIEMSPGREPGVTMGMQSPAQNEMQRAGQPGGQGELPHSEVQAMLPNGMQGPSVQN